ncbi:MAG: ADOP family duplicated permease [Vicinamibacterales bacterium]
MPPPRLARWLAALLPGRDAEGLRGDLDEAWARRHATGGPRWRHVAAHLGDVIASVAAGGHRRGVADRRRARRHDAIRGSFRMPMTGLGSEFAQAARALARRPLRTTLVVVTLAAGIAAVSTITAVADAVVVRPLPYPDGDRLVSVGRIFPDRPWREDAPALQRLAGTSIATFEDWRARTRALDRLVAAESRSVVMPDSGRGPELVGLVSVTDGFLDLFGVEPELGRAFGPADYAPGAPEVMMLSHRSWQARYGGEAGVIGRTEGRATIVGVLPPDFDGPEAYFSGRAEFWTPLLSSDTRYADRGRRSAFVFGRLAPGVTLEQARADIAAIQDQLTDTYPSFNLLPNGGRFGAGVNRLHDETVGGAARPLAIFLAAAALLLVVAGMNSANLLVLRALERETEVTVRRALGAGRLRLAAGLLTESLILATAGAAAGLLIARGSLAAFVAFGPGLLPRMHGIVLGGRVLLLAGVVSIGTGLAAGLLPALALLRNSELGTGLRRAGAPTVTPGGTRWRHVLVSAQMAAALVLVIGAGLLFHSLLRVRATPLGFAPDDLYAVSVPLKMPGLDRVAPHEIWNRVATAFDTVPGVDAVALGSDAPFVDPSWAPWVSLPGDDPGTRRDGVAGFVVTPGFFGAIGARLTRGDGFDPAPLPGGDRVVVVNDAFVDAFLGNREPIGATVLVKAEEAPDTRIPLRIVGVVESVVQRRVEDGARPALYVPYTQEAWPFGVTVMVRTARRDDAVADDLRAAAARFNPLVPVQSLTFLPDRIDGSLAEPRFRAALFGTFAGVSFLLAVVGLYGVLSHTVGRRTRELGVRMALGADRASVFGLVLRQGAGLVGAGLVAGLAGAALVSRSLQAFLFDLDALDLPTFAVAAGAMVAVSIVAIVMPARRATRLDVATTLRD